jgi:outer membrane protein OmpA-like peptidoglycan-associated protein
MKQLVRLLFILLSVANISAQQPLQVRRCAGIDRNVPINNIYIDRDNNKWVADAQGLFLAQSPDFAKTIAGKSDQWNLLEAPNGNQELSLPKTQLEELIKTPVSQITAASIDAAKKELWIGTADKGLFLLNTKNGLQLIEQVNNKNSKLRSNKIQAILLNPSGQLFAATDDGLFSRSGKKEELTSKGYNITALASHDGIIWVIADGEVLEMDNKGNLYENAFDDRMFDGTPVDIDFDNKGNLWIASEVVVRYHFATETFDFFGPAEDFTSQSVKCIVTDSDGAAWVGTQSKGVYYIGQSSSLNGSLVVTEYLDCKAGSKNAALEVRATGGQPPYTFQWNQPGLSGDQQKNLGPGKYAVTITDQKGKKATPEITIKESTFTISTRQLKEAALGGGKDGSAIIEVKGGGGVFLYKWDNGETTATAVQLTAGEHSVTISEKDGCATSTTVNITEKLAALAVSLNQSANNNCYGDQKAAAKAMAIGGQAPYRYQWSGTSAASEEATALAAGKYKVVVTDANNNTTSAEITIEQPAALTASVEVKSPATANSANGKAKVKAQGGSGKKYSYKWDSGETEENAVKLALGTHTVTVIDENGCTTSASVQITEDILPLSVQLNNTTTIKCVGDNSATIIAEVSGGKSPFTYQWSVAGAKGETASGLAAGAYQLTVTDAAANTAVAKTTIVSPEPLSASANPKAPATANNADGKATAKAIGGTGKKYLYKWDTGETEATANKLAAGIHTVTVTDENGCATTANITITEDILPLSVTLNNSASIKCADDKSAALEAEVNGGKSPFTYAWSATELKGEKANALAAGEYSLTVTDAAGTTATTKATIKAPALLELSIKVEASATTNNADGRATAQAKGGTGKYSYKWDNNETTITSSKLAPGQHQLTVTDENGCTATANITITENVLPLSVSIKQTADIKCHGERTAALEVSVQGGKAPFDYRWNNAAVKGAKAAQLSGGEYVLTLTDASGLSQITNMVITEPAALTVSLEKSMPATNENSRDGKASLSVTGGTIPYSYNWDTKETASEAVKLPIGGHSVTVTDANGCSSNLSLTTEKKILPALTAGQLQQGQTLQVSNLFFEADSTNMTPESYPTLIEIAGFLTENPLVVIEVGGHTNNIPTDEFCDALSSARAKAVAEFIIKNGIDANRVLYKGYGKREPKFSNNNKEGRAKNQRVEIKILALQ